jgi:hypothetical protein
MAPGKPMIASVNEVSEAGRMIQRAKCRVVVPPDEPMGLAALRELHRRPENRQSLGVAGRRDVTDRYERSDVLSHFSNLVEAHLEKTTEGQPRLS